MLPFILVLLSLILLFRLGGLFMGLGLFGGFFGGVPFWMGGYRHYGPWGRRPPMGPHGGMHHGCRGRF